MVRDLPSLSQSACYGRSADGPTDEYAGRLYEHVHDARQMTVSASVPLGRRYSTAIAKAH
jgi:hypothetical protein